MSKVFTSHPCPPELAEENDQLFIEVGRTLSTWMSVEAQAQQTFTIALGVWTSQSARGVFHAAINANARLAMVNEAVTHALDNDEDTQLLARWSKIYASAKKLAKRRNAVAHGSVSIIHGLPDDEGNSYALGVRIIDPLVQYPTIAQQLAEGMSLKQLLEIKRRFQDLSADMFQHGQELYALLRQRRESQQP